MLLSLRIVQKGKERGEGPNLSFIKGDLSALPFENEQFESIMAINSLEWTEEPLRALNEIKRVLKKDGYVNDGIRILHFLLYLGLTHTHVL
ncbi:class I SAM-dependent methyltransferase, partial [Bacillus sp. HC-Mk]